LEQNRRYRNLSPYGEPQLGKRNLYRSTGGGTIASDINAKLYVLNLSDGDNSVLDIAEKSSISFSEIQNAVDALINAGLLKEVGGRKEKKVRSGRA
jgi:aminopeptidase-like protein